ncbi:MAG: hypothetical protein IJO14_05830 [Clostridia bacterium]|nr:hypothetical protein [Clostridia bacterium]
MEWEVVKISQMSGNNVPFVSIGRGQLDFNAVSCDLVGDCGQYKYAKLFKGKEKGKTVIAVKFLTEAENDTIPIKRKKQNGKVIKGMIIVNKGVIKDLFGKNGSNEGSIRYSVELIEHNMLKIVE